MFRKIFCSGLLLAAMLSGGAAGAQDLQPAHSLLAPSGAGEAATATDTAPADPPTPETPATLETRSLNLGSEPAPAPKEDAIDPDEIPQILLDELATVERICNGNYMYSSFHDCSCIVDKFLEARIKSSPQTPRDTVFKQLAPLCINQPGIVGYIYPSCHDIIKLSKPDRYRQICECTVRTVAAEYTARPILNLRYIENLRNKALMECGLGQ